MHYLRRKVRRRLRRFLRPGVALLLVLAQGVAAFGFPVVRARNAPGGCGGGACGCDAAAGACGVRDGCCCDRGPAAPRLPHPAPAPAASDDRDRSGSPTDSCCRSGPEPGPESCPRCRTKSGEQPSQPAAHPDPTARIKWVAGLQARQCRGDGPLGSLAELPAVPPVIPVGPGVKPGPTGHLSVLDENLPSVPADPLEPPPRRR